uniref:reticulocyte-binding protein 1 isoform X1 n=1 Tax=Erigeron canadensis TaxID=72917 RepID=UPI001CB8C31A|nr:reticulocyte-binding protein 1 isoform X1 [Erigeron canadensis]
MATETEIPESVYLKKGEREDNVLSENLEEKVTELSNQVKQLESSSQPLETSSQVAETVNTLETGKATNESETFIPALSVPMVTSNTLESCEATTTEEESKTFKIEDFKEGKPNIDEQVEAVSTIAEPEEATENEEKYDEKAIEKNESEGIGPDKADSELGLKLSESMSSSKKEVLDILEKNQGQNDDVPSSQDGTHDDLNETTTTEHETTMADFKEQDPSEKPREFLKEETEDILTDACISTQTTPEVKVTEHDEKDEKEAGKPDSPAIKEVCEETGKNVEYQEQAVNLLEKGKDIELEQEVTKDQGKDEVIDVKDGTFEGGFEEKIQQCEDNDHEVAKAKESIEEDTKEVGTVEAAEKTEQQMTNVIPPDVCIATHIEPEEKVTENEVRNDERANENDDGQTKKSEKAESEEGSNFLDTSTITSKENETASHDEDQQKEQELYMSEKGQTQSLAEEEHEEEVIEIKDDQKENCDNVLTKEAFKETDSEKVKSESVEVSDSSNIELNEKAVAILSKDETAEKEQELNMSEQGQEEDVVTCSQDATLKVGEIIKENTEEIKTEKAEQQGLLHPTTTDDRVSSQAELQEEVIKNEEKAIEVEVKAVQSDGDQMDKSDNLFVKEVCEEAGLKKTEAEEGIKISDSSNMLVSSQDAEPEEDLQEKSCYIEDNKTEIVETRENVDEVESSVKTEEETGQQKLVHVITTDSCSSAQTEIAAETFETDEKNEEATENNDGQLNLESAVKKQELTMSEVQGGEDDLETIQKEDEKKAEIGQYATTVEAGIFGETTEDIIIDEAKAIDVQEANMNEDGEKEEMPEGIVDKTIGSCSEIEQDQQTKEIIPSIESNAEEDVFISTQTESPEEATKNDEKATEPDSDRKENSHNPLIKEASDETNLEKSECEKQTEFPETSNLNLDEDVVTCSQDETLKVGEIIKENTEEIKTEKAEQQGLLHPITTDDHISSQAELQEDVIKNEEKAIEIEVKAVQSDSDQMDKSDNVFVKEVCEETDLKKTEAEEGLKISDSSNMLVSSQDAAPEEDLQEKSCYNEGNETEIVETRETVDKVESSVETEEETEQQKLLHAINTDSCSSAQTKIPAETFETEEKDEEAIENDDGKINLENVVKKQELMMSEVQGGGDDLETIQKEDEKKAEIGQHATTVEAGDSDETTKEIIKDEAKTIDVQEANLNDDGEKEEMPKGIVDKTLGSCSEIEQDQQTKEIIPSLESNAEEDVLISTQTESPEEATKNAEKATEPDSDRKENSHNPLVKEASDETNLEKSKCEKQMEFPKTSNLNLDEKSIPVVTKDEDQEKEQELTDETAVYEENLEEKKDIDEQEPQIKNQNESNEPELVETRGDDDTQEIKSSVETNECAETKPKEDTVENEESKDEDTTENDDDQTKKSESPMVKEVCEPTSSDKAESEEAVKVYDSHSTTMDDNEMSKEENLEPEQVTKISEIQGDEHDVISSQIASNEETKENTIGQHATTVACFEEGQGVSAETEEIIKEEAEDESIDAQKASEQCEIDAEDKAEQNPEESINKSVNSCSEIVEENVKKGEETNREIQAELDADSQPNRTVDGSEMKDEVVSAEKMPLEVGQSKEQYVEDIQTCPTESLSEKTEDEITKKNEHLSYDKIEDKDGNTNKEDKTFLDGRTREIEVSTLEHAPVEEKNDDLDEESKEKVTDLIDTMAIEPQEDSTPSNSLETSTEDSSSLEKVEAESENLSKADLESGSEVQIPEVLPTSEESKQKEGHLDLETITHEDEEKGNITNDVLSDEKQATEIMQETFEEVCEGASSEKAELKESLKLSDSSNMEIQEKGVTFPDEDQEKDQDVNISIEGQGKENVTSSYDAVSEKENLQERSYQNIGDEHEFLETGECVDEDTKETKSSVESKENEFETPMFKEVCEATTSEKAESEDGVKHPEAYDTKSDENEIASKEENLEKDQELTMSEVQGNVHDATSTNAVIKETIICQPANTVHDFEEGQELSAVTKEIIEEEARDKSIDAQEANKESQDGTKNESEKTEYETTKEENDTSLDSINDTNDNNTIEEKCTFEHEPVEEQNGGLDVASKEILTDLNETAAVEPEDITPSSSLGISTEDTSNSEKAKSESEILEIAMHVDEEKRTATEEISSEQESEKLHISTEENVTKLEQTAENSSPDGENDTEEDVSQKDQLNSTEVCREKITDVILTKEIEQVTSEIQKENETTDFEEQVFDKESYSQIQKEMAHEVSLNEQKGKDLQVAEGISCESKVKHDNVDQIPNEEQIPSPEDGAIVEPEVDLQSKIESTAYPSESEKLPIQTSELITELEDSKVKEECIVLETAGHTAENKVEGEQIIRTDKISSAPDTEEENERSSFLQNTEEKSEALESKSEHMTEEKLEVVKMDLEEDVAQAQEDQNKGIEEKVETEKNVILADQVVLEPTKENERIEDAGELLDNTSISNQTQLTNEIEYAKPIPVGHTEETEMKAESHLELDNISAAEDLDCFSKASSTLEASNTERDDITLKSITTIREVKDDSVDVTSKDEVVLVAEDIRDLELEANLPELKSTDIPSDSQDSMKVAEGIPCSTQETTEVKDDDLISKVENHEALVKIIQQDHTETTNDKCDTPLAEVSSEKLLDEPEKHDAKDDTEEIAEGNKKALEESYQDAVAEVMVQEQFSQTEELKELTEKLESVIPSEEPTPPMDEDQTNELTLEAENTKVEHGSLSNKDKNPEVVEEEFANSFSEDQSIKERYVEEEVQGKGGVEDTKERSGNEVVENLIVNEVLVEDETTKENISSKDNNEDKAIQNQPMSVTQEVSQIERLSSSPDELIEKKDLVEDAEKLKLVAEDLEIKDKTFTVMKESNEAIDIPAPETENSESMVTEDKEKEADADKEKEPLEDPRADDPAEAVSGSILSSLEQDINFGSDEYRDHGEVKIPEEKPAEAFEITSEVAEIVPNDREVSAISTDGLPETSLEMPIAKHDMKLTTTPEKIEDEIKDKEAACKSVEKTGELNVSILNSKIVEGKQDGPDEIQNKENEPVQPQKQEKLVDPPEVEIKKQESFTQCASQESPEEIALLSQNDKKIEDSPTLQSVEEEIMQSLDKGFEEDPVDVVNNAECSEVESPKLDTKKETPEFVNEENQRDQKYQVNEHKEAATPTEDVKSSTLELEVPSAMDKTADKESNTEKDPEDTKAEVYEAEKEVLTEIEYPGSTISITKPTEEVPGMKQEMLELDVPTTLGSEATEDSIISQKHVTDLSHEQAEPTKQSFTADAEDLNASKASGTEAQYGSEVAQYETKTSDEKDEFEFAESTKGKTEVAENLNRDFAPPLRKDQQVDKEKTVDSAVKADEENEEDSEKLGSCSDAPVMVEASKDMDVKVHKKSHNMLSGVGSKVKHSIAKVKKAITGKSFHPKPTSP